MPVSRRVECIPANQDSSGPLRFMQPDQEICEADDRAATLVSATPNRLWKPVVGAMSKGVPVNGKQRLAHEVCPAASPASLLQVGLNGMRCPLAWSRLWGRIPRLAQ
jgi:hypothetical protein